ncbi:hypothetical protein ACE14D_08745, partial [Streptomyces sp. Act-28]
MTHGDRRPRTPGRDTDGAGRPDAVAPPGEVDVAVAGDAPGAHARGEALGWTDQTSRPPRVGRVDHLADRSLLLVLDGFEHLVDTCAE